MKRAQLFSMDFIVAIAVLTAIIGVTLHVNEFMQRDSIRYSELSNNEAEVIADAMVSGASVFPKTNYCYFYSNSSTNCTSTLFSCEKNVFAAKRLVKCHDPLNPLQNTWCMLEVRVCQ